MKGLLSMHHNLRSTNCMAIMLILITLAGAFVENGLAQVRGAADGGTACLDQLMPCLNYLTRDQGQGRRKQQDAPDSCCNPLKSVIKSRPGCLCSMISNQATKNAESAGINVTQAQELPARCGQRINPISCLTTANRDSGAGNSQNSANSRPCYSLHLLVLAAVACYILHS